MSSFERFAVILGYCSVSIFLLVLLGVGVTLTLISAGVGLVSYYPLTLADWVMGKKLKGNK